MAESDSTTFTGETRWDLLEQLPPGSTKDNLIEIQKLLEKIEKVKEVLFTWPTTKKSAMRKPSPWLQKRLVL